MRKYRNTVESPERPGFHISETSERLLVSEDGRFFDLVTDQELKAFYNNFHPYPVVRVPGAGDMFCHRVVAKTFLECPGYEHQYQVNHIDGNKDNFKLENLEWCTRSENALHAYKTGLRSDNTPIEVLDLRTGEILSFYSMQECGRFFGVNAESIHRFLNGNGYAPYRLFYNLRYTTGEWFPLDASDIGRKPSGSPNNVVAISPDAVMIFEGVSTAARYLGLSHYRISKHAAAASDALLGGYIFRFLDQVNPEMISLAVRIFNAKPAAPQRKPTPVVSTNTMTGEVLEWKSTAMFAAAHNVPKNTVQKSMLKNDGRWRHYVIKYKPRSK